MRRVSRRALREAEPLYRRCLEYELDDLARSAGRTDGWFARELAELLLDAEEQGSTWTTTAAGLRVCRIRWRRGLRVRLVCAEDGQLVQVLPESESRRR